MHAKLLQLKPTYKFEIKLSAIRFLKNEIEMTFDSNATAFKINLIKSYKLMQRRGASTSLHHAET